MNPIDGRHTAEMLSVEFAQLTELFSAGRLAPLTPQSLVDAAFCVVPHAQGCAISWASGTARPRTLAASSQLAAHVDRIQFDAQEGPCLDSLDKDDLTIVEDLGRDPRWPEFARRCLAETPVRSLLCVRLMLPGTDRAAMNFHADAPGRFTEMDHGVATIFGSYVAAAVRAHLEHERADNLQVALQSSRQIGTAMGILMARELITSEQAFELLRRASQHLNRKLREVAAEVEMTGTLPGMDDRPGRGGGPLR